MDPSVGENASQWVELRSKTAVQQREVLLRCEQDAEQALKQTTQQVSTIIAELRDQPYILFERRRLKAAAEQEYRRLESSPLIASVDFDADGRLLVRTRPRPELERAALLIAVDLEAAAITVTWDGGHTLRAADNLLDALFQDAVLRSVISQLTAAGRLDTLVAVVVAEVARTYAQANWPISTSIAAHLIRQRLYRLFLRDDPSSAQQELEASLSKALRRQERFCRELVRVHAALADLEENGQWQERAYMDEYRHLCRLPHVRKITVKGQRVYVFTDTITLKDEKGDLRRIGRFRIDIDTVQSVVKMRNLNRALVIQMDNLDHPHVKGGNPCLGNMRSFLISRFAARLIADIVPQTVEFLLSYNADDCFCKASAWPSA